MAWLKQPIKAVLLDISGVLADFGGGTAVAISDSVQAVMQLQKAGIPFRLCTNDTQKTRSDLRDRLADAGFPIKTSDIFSPAPAMRAVLERDNLRPHLLIHGGLEPEFDGIATDDANCVVLGDAAQRFTYDNLNAAFNVLLQFEPGQRRLYALGKGRYYKETDGMKIDVGAFVRALEYALDIESIVIGKPSAAFFQNALTNCCDCRAEEAVMIGDDVVSDVGGAQKFGMRGVLVKTGKYRRGDETRHDDVRPDGVVDNLGDAITQLLAVCQANA